MLKTYPSKRMNCDICRIHKPISFRDAEFLRNFMSEQAKILPRKKTRLCAKHQRRVAKAIKRARIMALLPFTTR